MMMTITLVFGYLLILVGILLLVVPRSVSNASKFLNKKIFDDTAVLSHRIAVAILCLAVGAVVLFNYYIHLLR